MDVTGIFNQVVSHAQSTGLFEGVNTHEPKNAPGRGLTAAIWVQSIGPTRGGSGLAITSGLLVLTLRIYTNMIAEPADAIDPDVLTAVDTLLAAYSGDFELGGNVRCVDLLGQSGTALSATAGYLSIGNTMMRVMDITLPLIVNDIWTQEG